MSWRLFQRTMSCVFLGGVRGVAIGMCAGALVGVPLFVVGAFFGAVVAMPFGFIAGLIGVTLGGRWGWAAGGALSLAVPCLVGFATDPVHAGLLSLALSAIGGLYGLGVGWLYGTRAPEPCIETDEAAADGRGRVSMSLYQIPLPYRLLAIAAVMVLSAGTLWDGVRIVHALGTIR